MTPHDSDKNSSSFSVEDGQHSGDEHANLDELLHPNVLDTLADFDFVCGDFSGIQADAKAVSSTSTNDRGRSGPQPLDMFMPKVTVNEGLLPGVWDNLAGAATVDCLQQDSAGAPKARVKGCDALFLEAPTSDPESNVAEMEMLGRRGEVAREDGRGKGLKGRKVSAGTKRPLNPDRMERKASREKRRREEVNEKFEQLLRVLEEAEGTSGLEPQSPEDGQQTSACVNGRRVEVLSRTIYVLKKLLHERRVGASRPCEVAAEPVDPVKVALMPAPATIAEPPAFADSTDGPVRAAPAGDAGSCPTLVQTPVSGVGGIAAPAAASGVAGSAPAPAVQVSVPVHGHPTVMLPPGFTVPGGLQASLSGMPQNLSNQPIFIALPMYMPGQGMGSGAAEAATPTAPGQVPFAATPAATSAQEAALDEEKPAPSTSPVVSEGTAKEGSSVPGVGFPPLMTVQMPQFVARALSGQEGVEKVTHAMCA